MTAEFAIDRQGATVVVYDARRYPSFEPAVFDDDGWQRDPAEVHVTTGRGGVRMLDVGNEIWVRRHYHRGGFVSKFVHDRYLWRGITRSRPARELHLLARMRAEGLPVPLPVAGRAVRVGMGYRADLITVLMPGTFPLSRAMATGSVEASVWPRVGSMLGRFHGGGYDHPDLTAHNILVDDLGQPSLLDFDNAVQRRGNGWKAARIRRLLRSLRKVALETGTEFDPKGWAALLGAYQSA